MADNYNPALDLMSSAASAPQEGTVSWGDRGKALVSGAADTGADIASGARAAGDATGYTAAADLADFFRSALKAGGEDTTDSMSETARDQLRASLTSKAFWDHPVSASILKTLNMAPGVAAAVIPVALTDGALAPWLAAGSGAVLGAGQSADDTYSQTDSMSDGDLQNAMPYYAGLRSMGMSEDEARAQANTKLMGLKPLANAVAGAAAMVLGPAGRMAGVIPEEAGAGLLNRMAVGGGEGALGGALMSGTGEYTRQQTEIELDKRTDIDPAQLMTATAEGMLVQGAMGMGGGALTRSHGPVETVDAHAPDAAQTLALNDNQPERAPMAAETPPQPETPPVAQTPPQPAPVQSPAPEPVAVQPAPTVEDAGQTVPEAPATLDAQREQLLAGQRQAMLYPKGNGAALDVPPGMKRTVTKDGTFIYNPKLLKPGDIYAASKAGELNRVLALGDYSKNDVMARVAAGEAPVAVTERAPDGTEVKAAAGTEGTAPDQIASLEASKTPGNTVQVESGQRVLQDRAAAARDLAPTIRQKAKPAEPIHVADEPLNELPGPKMAEISARLESIWQAAEKQEADGNPIKGGIAAFIERKREQLVSEAKAEQIEVPTAAPAPRARAQEKGEGKHYTKKQVADRAKNAESASEVVNRFAPSDDEANYRKPGMAGSMARQAIFERAKAMVEAAEREGVKIPAKIKDTTDKSMEHPPAVILLTEAKSVIAPRKKGSLPMDQYDRFLTRERLLRSGDVEDRAQVLSDRRVEGDQKMTVRSKGHGIEGVPDAEAEIRAERERLENVPDEPEALREEAEAAENPEDSTQAAGQERAPVTLKGNEVVAGKDRAGSFAIEKKRSIKRRLGEDEDHEPISHAEILGIRPLRHSTLDDFLNVGRARAGSLNEKLEPYIAKRIRQMVGKIEVNVISRADMALLDGRPTEHPDVAMGMFINDEGRKSIYVRKEIADNPDKLRHTLLHEGMHAAVEDVIETNAQHRETIEMMLNEVKQNVGAAAKRIYGLTDVHEFMSEAMSNPNFQELLGDIRASKELTKRLQLNSPLTLRDALVHAIRKILGLDNNPENFSLIEAALRTSNQLMATASNADLATPARYSYRASRAGDFTDAGNAAHMAEINGLFRDPLRNALGRTATRTKEGAKDLVGTLTSPAKLMSSAIDTGRATGSVMSKALNAVITNDQFRQNIEKLVPMSRQIFDDVERSGVDANKMKEEGLELTGALIRAQTSNPGAFERFAQLIHEQTMHGVDASSEIGEGRNGHLQLSKELMDKIAKGQPLDDVAHEAAMASWAAREAHPTLQGRYNAILKANPEFGPMQKHLFDFYDKSQSAMVRGQIDSILRAYDFKGTDAERTDAARQIYSGKIVDDFRAKLEANIGRQALKQLEDTKALKVVNGPYAPLMRRGEHVILGEYKVDAPANGKKIDDDTYEFKTRKEAHDFAVKTALHAEPKIVYYDSATGERVKNREDAISTAGSPDQRFQVKLQRQHVEFHERENDAHARIKELQESGLFDKLGLEERRRIETETSEFSGRGVESLLRSLAAQKRYQDATDTERSTLRQTIREAGLRSMSDNRVQSRRIPRRFVQGASDDISRNLYEYNNSQANYRAKLKYRDQIDDGLKSMWDHVKANRFTNDNEQRSAAANEVEKRVHSLDPNEYSGAYTDWTRRLSTWSYIDRMMRPSHLILHQTHLPMITAPYMAGRHGLMNAFGSTLKAWKELTGFYGAGGRDAWAATMDSALRKGTDYTELGKKAFSKSQDGVRIGKMLDTLGETGVIHPSAGIEVHKYLPSKQLGGLVGGLDRGLNKVDTIFRHLTNSTEAINRIAGATAAYRMEFSKLTRASKSETDAHTAATEYARKVLTDTQGLYSGTNAAPLFKNKFLKPFLQFKQFPQMMYHLLSRLAVTALKGETRQAKIEAMASLGTILGMHAMMAGALQGLPLEPFKLLGLISKGIGLTDGDWTDVEQSVSRSMQNNLGKDTADLFLHGLGAQMGVDVHHRLGLNSFVTYGMPDQLDSKNVSEFLMNAVIGAPGGMITDAVKGTHKMLTGDIEGGALQAFPLQAFRDIHNAVNPSPNSYGYTPTGADRVKSLLGFTPEAKAQASEGKEAVYNATQEYNEKRAALTKSWVQSSASERDNVWEKIQDWNEGQPAAARLTKGDLFKSLSSKNKMNDTNSVMGIRTNAHNRAAAESVGDLYN